MISSLVHPELEQARAFILGAGRAVVLPSLANPKLVLPCLDAASCWRGSGLYPAFKPRAKPWRMLQRLRGLIGLAPMLPSGGQDEIKGFICDVLPGVTHSAALLGTPGPHRKIIVQLWRGPDIAGYLKVAASAAAADKIRAEAAILQVLPRGVGPRLLKTGSLCGAEAILMAPIQGRMLNARLPRSPARKHRTASELYGYLQKMQIREKSYFIEDHPAIARISAQFARDPQLERVRPLFEKWKESLYKQSWPVVIQHGDFAPWNVLRQEDGALCAIDWEEAILEGFPFLDLVYYVWQTAFLIHQWRPDKAFRYTEQLLMHCGLPLDMSDAVTRVAALDVRSRLRASADKASALQACSENIFNSGH